MVAGLTLVAVLGGLGGFAYYLAQRSLPEIKPVDGGSTPTVARPSVDAKLDGRVPIRPGVIAHPPDEIYYAGAKDVVKLDIEGPVNGLLAKYVITMFPDGKFRPNDPLPRAEFATWCYNAVMAQSVSGNDPFVTPKKPFKTVEATGEEFGDVSADHWAVGVLAQLKASGLLEGFLTSHFRPDAPLTREEWAAFACHLAALPETLTEALDTPVDRTKFGVALRKLNFTDYKAVKPAFMPYVHFIISDDKRSNWLTDVWEPPQNPGPWKPGKAMTRAEAAVWIGGFYEELGKGLQ